MTICFALALLSSQSSNATPPAVVSHLYHLPPLPASMTIVSTPSAAPRFSSSSPAHAEPVVCPNFNRSRDSAHHVLGSIPAQFFVSFYRLLLAWRPFFPSDGADAVSGQQPPQIKARQLLNIRTEIFLALLTILSAQSSLTSETFSSR